MAALSGPRGVVVPTTRAGLEEDLRGMHGLLADKDLLSRLPDKGRRVHENAAFLSQKLNELDEKEAVARELAAGRARLLSAPLKVNEAISAPPPQPMAEGEEVPPARAHAPPPRAASEPHVDPVVKRAVRFDSTADKPLPPPPRAPAPRRPTEAQLAAAEGELKSYNVTRDSVADDRAPMLVQIEAAMRADPAAGKRLTAALDVLSAHALHEVQAKRDDEECARLFHEQIKVVPQPSVALHTQRRVMALSTEESLSLEDATSRRRADERRQELMTSLAASNGATRGPTAHRRPRQSYRDMFAD
eukprot:TRINITY_DN10469_c0_g2_i3.p1 TRINITY_DN10469_c0_g2~~TRINITY_DN10469_c0_g2_i3.p1  ORF type:complete len:303 (+),score=93.61 TRINITY_DN10469_c0_g2_i3:90-998(+)